MKEQLTQLVGSEEFKALPPYDRHKALRTAMSGISPSFGQLSPYQQAQLMDRVYQQAPKTPGFGERALTTMTEYLPSKETLAVNLAPLAVAQAIPALTGPALAAPAIYEGVTQPKVSPLADKFIRLISRHTTSLRPEAIALALSHGMTEEQLRARIEDQVVREIEAQPGLRVLENLAVAGPEMLAALGLGGAVGGLVQKQAVKGVADTITKIAGAKTEEAAIGLARSGARRMIGAKVAGTAANLVTASTVFELGATLGGKEFDPIEAFVKGPITLAALGAVLHPVGRFAQRMKQGPVPPEVAAEMEKPEFQALAKDTDKLIRAYAADTKMPLDAAAGDVLEMIASPAVAVSPGQVGPIWKIGETLTRHPELLASDVGIHFARKMRGTTPTEWVEEIVTAPGVFSSKGKATGKGVRITYETKVSRKPTTVIAADVAEARKILGDEANNILEVKAKLELLEQLKLKPSPLGLPSPILGDYGIPSRPLTRVDVGQALDRMNLDVATRDRIVKQLFPTKNAFKRAQPQDLLDALGTSAPRIPLLPEPNVIAGLPPATRSGRGAPWERQFVGVPPAGPEPQSLEAAVAREAVQAAQVDPLSSQMEVMLNSPKVIERVVEAAGVGNPNADPYASLRGAAPMIGRPEVTPAISGAARPEAQAPLFERPSATPSLAGVAGEGPRAPEVSPAQLAAGLAELGVEGVEPALAPKVPQARGSAETPPAPSTGNEEWLAKQKLVAVEDAVRAAGLTEPGAIKTVADMVAADVIKPGQAGPLAAVVAEQRPPRGPVTTLAEPKPAIRPDPTLQAMSDKQLLAHGETAIFVRATAQTRWTPETAEKVAAYMDEVIRRTGVELPPPTAAQVKKGLFNLFLELRAENRSRLTGLAEAWKTNPEGGFIRFWGPRAKQPARDFATLPEAEPVKQLAELMGYRAYRTKRGSYLVEIPDGANVFQLRFGSRESALMGLRRMAQQAGDFARYQKQLAEISAGFEGKVSPETMRELAAEWKQAPEFDEKGDPSVTYYEAIFGDRVAPINSWERLQIGHKGVSSLVVTAGRTVQGFGPGGERAVERMTENQTLQELAKADYMPRFQKIMATLTREEIRTGLHALARRGLEGRPELRKALDDLRALTLELYLKLEALGGPVAKFQDDYWPNVFDQLTVTGWRAAEKDVLPLIDELRSRGIIKTDAEVKDVLLTLLSRGIGTSREKTIAKLMREGKKKGFPLDRGNAGRQADEIREKLRDRYSGHLERAQNHAFKDEITDARHAWGTTILEEIRRVAEVQAFGLRDSKINQDFEAIRRSVGGDAERFAQETFAWEIGQERADLNPFLEGLYQLGAAKLSLAWINEVSSSRIKAWQAFGAKAYIKAMQETKFNPLARSRLGLEMGVNSPEIYGKIRRDSFGTTVDPEWWQSFWGEVLPEKIKTGTPMEKVQVGLEAWTRGMAGLHRIATESGRSLTGQMARFGFDEHLEMLRRGEPREMIRASKFFGRFGMPPDKMIELARSEDQAAKDWARDYLAVQATNEIQFRPGILTRPAWARGNGKYFYQFQTWSFNQARQIYEDLNYFQHKDWTRFRRTAAGIVMFMGTAPGAAIIRGILTKNTDPADKMTELAQKGGMGYLAAGAYSLAYSGVLGLYSDALLLWLDGDLWKNRRLGDAPALQTARSLFLDVPGLAWDFAQGEPGAERTATRLVARELAGGVGAAVVEHAWPKPAGKGPQLRTGGFGQGFGKGFGEGFGKGF